MFISKCYTCPPKKKCLFIHWFLSRLMKFLIREIILWNLRWCTWQWISIGYKSNKEASKENSKSFFYIIVCHAFILLVSLLSLVLSQNKSMQAGRKTELLDFEGNIHILYILCQCIFMVLIDSLNSITDFCIKFLLHMSLYYCFIFFTPNHYSLMLWIRFCF